MAFSAANAALSVAGLRGRTRSARQSSRSRVVVRAQEQRVRVDVERVSKIEEEARARCARCRRVRPRGLSSGARAPRRPPSPVTRLQISRQREQIAAQREAIARQRAALEAQQAELVATTTVAGASPPWAHPTNPRGGGHPPAPAVRQRPRGTGHAVAPSIGLCAGARDRTTRARASARGGNDPHCLTVCPRFSCSRRGREAGAPCGTDAIARSAERRVLAAAADGGACALRHPPAHGVQARARRAA